MKAICPKDSKHNRFIVTAHIAEEWIVNEHGGFVREYEQGIKQTIHGPDVGDMWQCVDCGETAKVTP